MCFFQKVAEERHGEQQPVGMACGEMRGDGVGDPSHGGLEDESGSAGDESRDEGKQDERHIRGNVAQHAGERRIAAGGYRSVETCRHMRKGGPCRCQP